MDGGTESLLSKKSHLLTSSFDDVLSACIHRFNLNVDLIPPPSVDNNNPANDSLPSIFDKNPPPTLISSPSSNTYIFLSVFYPHPPTFELKHHPHHTCNDCPNGCELDDDINSNNTIITNIDSDNSQPSIFFNDNPGRDFNDDITSKFIFDLKAKTTTDDDTDAAKSIVFDDKPNRKSDYDNSDTDSKKQSHYYDDTCFLEQ